VRFVRYTILFLWRERQFDVGRSLVGRFISSLWIDGSWFIAFLLSHHFCQITGTECDGILIRLSYWILKYWSYLVPAGKKHGPLCLSHSLGVLVFNQRPLFLRVRKFLGNKGVFSETFVLHTNRNLILFSIAHWLRCCFLFLSLESLRSSWSKLSEISWRYLERSSEKKTMKTFTVITTVVEFFGPFYDDCYLICCWNEHLFVCLYSSHFNSLQAITN